MRTHSTLYGRVTVVQGLLIRTFGYGVALAERIREPGEEPDGITAADAVLESGIRHKSLIQVPGNQDKAFFIMENTDPPHPFQSAQLHEVADELRSSVESSPDESMTEAVRLLGII
jgi:hypothetical protein